MRLSEEQKELASGPDAVWQALQPLIAKAAEDRDRIRRIERDEIGAINTEIEAERLETRAAELRAARGAAVDVAATRAATEQRLAELKKRYAEAETRLSEVVAQTSLTRVTLAAVDGTEKESRRLISFARIGPTSCRSAGGSESTRAVCGNSSRATRANRTPRAASSRRFSGP